MIKNIIITILFSINFINGQSCGPEQSGSCAGYNTSLSNPDLRSPELLRTNINNFCLESWNTWNWNTGVDWTDQYKNPCRQGFSSEPPPNQGYCGSCYAFAISTAIEMTYAIKNLLSFEIPTPPAALGPAISASAQQFTSCSPWRLPFASNNFGCNGNYFNTILWWYKNSPTPNICTESSYPYVSGVTAKTWNPFPPPFSIFKNPPACEESTCDDKFTNFDYVDVPNTEAGILNYLRYGPLVVRITVGKPTFNKAPKGIVAGGQCGNGGHAVVIVGYGRIQYDPNPASNYFIIRNSWGSYGGDPEKPGYWYLKMGNQGYGTCNILQYKSAQIIIP